MTVALPANLPSPATARLPGSYETAKQHLAECARIDECKDWADKAAALASYARQADDDELEAFARRVRARAIRRCGELLKEIEARPEANLKQNRRGGISPSVTRKQAAEDAGLSPDQAKQAVRVANVPESEFEEAVEAPKPATVTALARKGTQSKPKPLVDLKGRDPADFKLATQIGGSIRYFAEELEGADPKAVVRGLSPNECGEVLETAQTITAWLGRFTKHLEKKHGV